MFDAFTLTMDKIIHNKSSFYLDTNMNDNYKTHI